ncbi:MAG: class I SAM-dependent methyltransferase [Actinobacteria bacterium]|jgi:tocopherol O-methyltransferase|nr:class I SAM-dependent methyltransferase [Actinomycetota bacterium]
MADEAKVTWSALDDDDLLASVQRTFGAVEVAQYYDEWTERYEAVFGDVFQHLKAVDREELFDHMAQVAEVSAATRVLDAGCGVCGPAIEFAARSHASIDAVTVSPGQADRAREHVAERGYSERIRVHVGDFHHLDESFGSDFDLVYFLESLVHAAEPADVIESAHAVLRPGGVLYIKDFYRGQSPDDPAYQRVIDECVAATNEICRLTIRNSADVLGWIEAAGFDIEVAQPLAVSAYSIDDGHEFCERYDLDVAAGRDFRNTFYLENLEIRARRR